MEKADKQNQETGEHEAQDIIKLDKQEEEVDPAAEPSSIMDDLNDMALQIKDLQDKLLRSMAETENVRARLNKNTEEAREYAITNFAKDLVPVIDNFKMALGHIPANLSEDMKNLVQGIVMTKDELERVFSKHGLESIEPQAGDNFDYNCHHAISQIMTDEYKAGTIVGTMQAGYKIKDRLIRPASVTVAKSAKGQG